MALLRMELFTLVPSTLLLNSYSSFRNPLRCHLFQKVFIDLNSIRYSFCANSAMILSTAS